MINKPNFIDAARFVVSCKFMVFNIGLHFVVFGHKKTNRKKCARVLYLP